MLVIQFLRKLAKCLKLISPLPQGFYIIKWSLLFLSTNALAGLQIPNGLNQDARKEFIKKIGFSSSYKYLSQGYILGGYDGLELSTTVSSIPFSRVNELGQNQLNESDKFLQNFSIGKGMFQNVDVYFTFSPFLFQNQISSYGLALRYMYYEDPDHPYAMGVLFHGNGLNISNLVGIQTSGLDIIANYYLNYWDFYFGLGLARSLGSFIGGDNGVTDDKLSADEDLFQYRFYSGFTYNFGSYSLTLQVDRVYVENLSAKIGTRF